MTKGNRTIGRRASSRPLMCMAALLAAAQAVHAQREAGGNPVGLTPLAKRADATVFTYVTIPTTNNIQTELYNTFPTGTFIANNALATPFSIPNALGKCGPSGSSPCNYYDGFGVSGSGTSITMGVSIASPTDVYTLMNAYKPAAGKQLATIQFVGTGGVSLTFPLIGGQDIRDYRQSAFASTLTNGVTGVQAFNAFSCNDPANCVSTAGGVDNLATDEQDFSLGSTFAGQTLTQIIVTDTYNGSSPILLGITVGSGTAAPDPANLLMNGGFEDPVISGDVLNVSTGSTAIPGWTVIGTAPLTVGIVSGAYVAQGISVPAEEGFQWLDLTGSGVSTGTRGITQTAPTIAGLSYLLTFWVGNVYDPGGVLGVTSTVGVKINGTSAGSFTNSAQVTTMNWQKFSITFTAMGNSTEIEFDNLDPPTDSSNGLDNVTLQEAVSGPQPPTISDGGVVSASSFGEFTSVSPGSWIEIYGSNLAVDTRSWLASDFIGVNAPTSLDGTSVTIGGQAAFIDFISPGQVNALVPSNVVTGTQPMTVTVAGVTSPAYSINVNPVQPGLDAPASFNIGGTQYVVALFADGTYVLPEGAIAGVNSQPAQPGDEIVLYGIGFGPVTPNLPAGQLVQQANTLASTFEMSIGGVPVTDMPYSGLAPNYTGLYQFNLVLPANTGTGAAPLTFTVDGVAGTQTLYLAVAN